MSQLATPALGIESLDVRVLLAAFSEFVDPNPHPDNQFGASMVPLSTGNVVVTSAFDDAGGTDAGAVHLFDGATGALISTLTGSSDHDNFGSGGVTALSNGNFVIQSSTWDNGEAINAGAVTLGSGETDISGPVSAIHSPVGTLSDDDVGRFGGTPSTNGNYVVSRPGRDNGGTRHVVRKGRKLAACSTTKHSQPTNDTRRGRYTRTAWKSVRRTIPPNLEAQHFGNGRASRL